MTEFSTIFFTLGGLFLLGLITDLIGRNTPLPRVSLLMLFGFLIGPSMLGLLPDLGQNWFPAVADMALVMIGFLLGGRLTLPFLKQSGRHVLWISLMDVIVTAIIVTTGLLLLGQPLTVALLLGAIAPATAPAATLDVVKETSAKGPFSSILLGVVGVDDIWGVALLSLMLSVAMAVSGAQGVMSVIGLGLWDLGGAILLGIALGAPMALLTGRVRPGEPTLIEALGFVFLCAGIALWMDVSFLLAAMVMGMVVANLAKHHSRPFHAISGIEWPFLTLFFALSGASLQLETLLHAGLLLLLYVVLRVLGRLFGATLGAICSKANPQIRRDMWSALMPQAGVALGMALYACQRFPELGELILPVIIGATILFEVFGPIMTRWALHASGETRQETQSFTKG